MKLVSWNIRAGGGVRADGIVEQINRWQPDVVALSEFRATAASTHIAQTIAQSAGLHHQRTTASKKDPARNALLVASRWPLRIVRLRTGASQSVRWLHVNVGARRPFAMLAVHVPNRVSGFKYPFLDALSRVAGSWRGPPGLIVGDTNSGRIDIDEESKAFNRIEDEWMQNIERIGWVDAWRALHAQRPAYTWYSPNGRNGFRLDQAFLQQALLRRLKHVDYIWAGATSHRREVLSDHAAVVLEFN